MKDRELQFIGTGKRTEYSQFIVLVCNIPHENYADAYQESVIEGLKEKWKKTHHDDKLDRIHIIYLHKDDDPVDKKFKPLYSVDQLSRIYIVGHCKPGSDFIESDPVYRRPNLKTGKVEKVTHQFSYVDIGLILLHNISSPDLTIRKDSDKITQDYLNSENRRLRIYVTPCYSAIDKIEKDGTIEKSFTFKLFNFLLNQHKSMLKCDLLGNPGVLVPIPTEPNLLDIFKLMLPQNKLTAKVGFHKRYFLVEGHKLSTLIPRHKPAGVDYKNTFVISPGTTVEEAKKNSITITKLTVNKGKQRLFTQIIAEQALNLCAHILKNKDDSRYGYNKDILKIAESLSENILNGLSEKDLLNSYLELLKKFDIYVSDLAIELCENVIEYDTYYNEDTVRLAKFTLAGINTGEIPEKVLRKYYINLLEKMKENDLDRAQIESINQNKMNK